MKKFSCERACFAKNLCFYYTKRFWFQEFWLILFYTLKNILKLFLICRTRHLKSRGQQWQVSCSYPTRVMTNILRRGTGCRLPTKVYETYLKSLTVWMKNGEQHEIHLHVSLQKNLRIRYQQNHQRILQNKTLRRNHRPHHLHPLRRNHRNHFHQMKTWIHFLLHCFYVQMNPQSQSLWRSHQSWNCDRHHLENHCFSVHLPQTGHTVSSCFHRKEPHRLKTKENYPQIRTVVQF